ncbi:MAG: GNAT family N-acetyltransferase [Kineosporiaceae bacterium]
MTGSVAVRDAAPGDVARWRELWHGYVDGRGHAVAADVRDLTWRRALDPDVPMTCRLAVDAGGVLGFSLSVLHLSTFRRDPVCYLEDLFVDVAARRRGAARSLLADLVHRGREQGWSVLYWHTRADNADARALYDEFVAADTTVRYRLPL